MKHSLLAHVSATLVEKRESHMLVGPPGVGKTDLMTLVQEMTKADLLVSHAVVSDPTDYKGMPAVFKDDSGMMVAKFLPFADLQQMIEATSRLIVFFDDLGQAPPAVQAALMQLVLSRKINGHHVSEHVVFTAASNRRSDKAAVTGLISPLLDRFITVLPLTFDQDDWAYWALTHDVPPVVVAFARWKAGALAEFEPSKDMKKTATPRSITGLGRLIGYGIKEPEAIMGAVGEEFGTEFIAFMQTWEELPNREDVYMNPDSTPVPEKPDVLFALMGSLSFGANPTNIEAMARYLERCPAEFRTLCMRDAIVRNRKITTSKAYQKWCVANKVVFGFDQ